LDADAFFASVEQAMNPELRGKAIAVGGRQRGIIASASYPARQRGVYTPMPTAQARKVCPELILVPGRYSLYERFSNKMFDIIRQYTPVVEQCSIDEGYFDLTGRREPIETLTKTIRDEIRSALCIPVSIGMGTSKLVTQIAAKMNKPESFCLVPPGSEAMFLYPLSNRWMPGVGEKTGRLLDKLGLFKVFHLRDASLELLAKAVGSYAADLKRYAFGIDDRPVVPFYEDAKSYGKQRTFSKDLSDPAEIEIQLKQMLDRLMEKIRADGKLARTVTLRIRYAGMEDVQGSESISEPTCVETEIYPLLRPLLERIWQKTLPIRMAGIKLSNIYDSSQVAPKLPLFSEAPGSREVRARLASAVDTLHHNLGRKSIGPARDLLDGE
jgi:DNA polymerase-4